MNVQTPQRILIVEDDESLVEQFITAADDVSEVAVLGTVKSVPEALDFIQKTSVDFVILDLELSNSHGIQFLNSILNGMVESPPHVIVITVVTGLGTLNDVHAKKVERIFWKGEDSFIQAGPQIVFEYIQEIAPFCDTPCLPRPRNELSESEFRIEIEKDLSGYGAAMGTKSSDYTVDAIVELTKLPPGYVNLKEDVYPKIMAKRGAKYKNVVNNIQYCITAMWDNLKMEHLAEAYTPKVDESKRDGGAKTSASVLRE